MSGNSRQKTPDAPDTAAAPAQEEQSFKFILNVSREIRAKEPELVAALVKEIGDITGLRHPIGPTTTAEFNWFLNINYLIQKSGAKRTAIWAFGEEGWILAIGTIATNLAPL